MAIDLDKLSSGMGDGLERARLLAEQRQQGQITPLHMLYVLLESDSALSSTLERGGMATSPLLDTLTTKLNKLDKELKLEPGKRPVASRPLRDLIEKEHQTPNPADLSGLLTAGTFHNEGRKVLGAWPISQALVDNLLGGK